MAVLGTIKASHGKHPRPHRQSQALLLCLCPSIRPCLCVSPASGDQTVEGCGRRRTQAEALPAPVFIPSSCSYGPCVQKFHRAQGSAPERAWLCSCPCAVFVPVTWSVHPSHTHTFPCFSVYRGPLPVEGRGQAGESLPLCILERVWNLKKLCSPKNSVFWEEYSCCQRDGFLSCKSSQAGHGEGIAHQT